MEVKFLYRDGPIGKMCEQLAFKVLFYFQERRLLQFVYLFFFINFMLSYSEGKNS